MDGAPIGRQAGEEQCPIELEVIGPGPGRFGLEVLTGLAKNSFQANFGQIPTQEISIVAMCNRDIDHCLIARLALHFGKYYDGLINMTGAIIPWERLPGQYRPEEVKDFLLGIGGTVWEILPEVSPDATAQLRPYHIVDVDFLEAWQQHPKFHMVK
jgi:Family of unknown function (DUF6368)